jgi:hypothetical protein
MFPLGPPFLAANPVKTSRAQACQRLRRRQILANIATTLRKPDPDGENKLVKGAQYF